MIANLSWEQAAFLALYPALARVQCCAERLLEIVDEFVACPPTVEIPYESWEIVAKDLFERADFLSNALGDYRIVDLDRTHFEPLHEGLDSIVRSDGDSSLSFERNQLDQGCDWVAEYIEGLAHKVFGYWGGCFFTMWAERATAEESVADGFYFRPEWHAPERIPEFDPSDEEMNFEVAGPSNEHLAPRWDESTEARNKWIYEQVVARKTYSSIIIELNKKPQDWYRIDSIPGIRKVAGTYAKAHGLPLPQRRQSGRPRK